MMLNSAIETSPFSTFSTISDCTDFINTTNQFNLNPASVLHKRISKIKRSQWKKHKGLITCSEPIKQKNKIYCIKSNLQKLNLSINKLSQDQLTPEDQKSIIRADVITTHRLNLSNTYRPLDKWDKTDLVKYAAVLKEEVEMKFFILQNFMCSR